jgi:hypothetical protein
MPIGILNIVPDLINALPGNSSVNTVQHPTINEAVFSTSSAPSSGGTTGLCNPFLRNGSVNTIPRDRWRHQQQRRCFLWGLCRMLIREATAVTEIHIWSWAPDGARYQDLLTDWPSVAMWIWLDLTELVQGQLRVSSSGRSTRTSKQAVNSMSTEEYKKSACEELTCDLKTLCVL